MFETTRPSLAARLALAFAILALLLLALAPLGYRADWWDFKLAIMVITVIAGGIALVAVLLALFGLIRTRPGTSYTGGKKAFLALLLAGGMVALLGYQAHLGKTYNYHDVTTDTKNPPSLADFADAEGRINSVEYDPQLIAKQQADYPQLGSLLLTSSQAEVHNAVLDLVRENDWQLVNTNTITGIVLATDTSLLYGFKDDMVIRIKPLPNQQTRVDMRSNSRVGESDLRKNAERIQCFFTQLTERLATDASSLVE